MFIFVPLYFNSVQFFVVKDDIQVLGKAYFSNCTPLPIPEVLPSVSMRSGKPICAPLLVSEVAPSVALDTVPVLV